ncbi:unnamed protein product [Pieris macdunnoughi]|uniref:Uncharacterized protein n=1 Tax=Pieris macdunnoughi TaxID=345717 RepID=A0A821MA45_9NEOP|nr:unnamed protein product [Pieris macdunnoughi]
MFAQLKLLLRSTVSSAQAVAQVGLLAQLGPLAEVGLFRGSLAESCKDILTLEPRLACGEIGELFYLLTCVIAILAYISGYVCFCIFVKIHRFTIILDLASELDDLTQPLFKIFNQDRRLLPGPFTTHFALYD